MTLVMEPVDSPPPVGRTIYPWEEVREQLTSHPGQWYIILRGVPDRVARHLKDGTIREIDPDLYEFVTRNNHHTNGVRRCDIYGVFVGNRKGN